MSAARAGATAVAAVAGCVLLLALLAWAASTGPQPVLHGAGIPVRTGAATPESTPTDPLDRLVDRPPPQTGPPPAWFRALAVLLEVGAVVVGLVLLQRLLRSLVLRWRERRSPPERPTDHVAFEVLDAGPGLAEDVVADAVAQRTALATGTPRNAIVACWHRLETTAERVGVRRRAWQTPSEFVLSVLDAAGADADAVLALADLYREARFSDHELTEDHRHRAEAALAAVHASLRPSRGLVGGVSP